MAKAKDSEAVIEMARSMGVTIKITKENPLANTQDLEIISPGLPLQIGGQKLHSGNSGITTRFALPMLGLRGLNPKPLTLTVDEQMQKRPIMPLITALNDLGMKIETAAEHVLSEADNSIWPLKISGELLGGETEVDGLSSQYLSALLLALPCAQNDSIITVKNLKERPYIQLTLDWLKEQGIQWEHSFSDSAQQSSELFPKADNTLDIYKIPGGQSYKPFQKNIPGDFSSASYPIAAAALLPGEVLIKGLNLDDSQGDKALIHILEKMGADIQVRTDGAFKIIGGKPLKGIRIDCDPFPDLVPTLAVIATQAEGKTELFNVEQARIKETDRIHSMEQGLSKMGAKIEATKDSLIIHGFPKGSSKNMGLHHAKVEGYEDHRTIMALALAGMCVKEDSGLSGLSDTPRSSHSQRASKPSQTTITTAEGMAKTFPNFPELMQSIGAKIQLKKPLIIMGFKHVGKTSLGMALSQATGKAFIDLDDQVVAKTKMSCRQLVKEKGLNALHEAEALALHELLEKNDPIIIALGGAAPMHPATQNLLKDCTCVHLTADPHETLSYILQGGWPSSFGDWRSKNPATSELSKSQPTSEEAWPLFKKLWDQRLPIYESLADTRISNQNSIETLTTHLAHFLQY